MVGYLSIGAETLREFALALFIGIAIGTYSSLFVASPVLAMLKEREPEWERRQRRARSADVGDDDGDIVETAPATVIEPTLPTARPPKQRRKRR